MESQDYKYDTTSFKYKRKQIRWRQRLVRTLAYLSSALFLALLLSLAGFFFLESPKEKALEKELVDMRNEYTDLSERVNQSEQILDQLGERDNSIYRVIFEAEPIPVEIRKAGFGGGDRYAFYDRFTFSELMKQSRLKIDQLEKQVAIQSKSYDELKVLVEKKEELLSAIPAIQPVKKSNDHYLASGFGTRFHPIYKTRRLHTGLDFSAPTGADVIVTGDGRVVKTEFKRSGYGYHIVVDHGFGYKTLYAHLSKLFVFTGQRIKRGQKIGLVGNTGTSTSPHLHYEVIKNGRKINPIHYFFNDLTPEEYEDIIQLAEKSNQSFD